VEGVRRLVRAALPPLALAALAWPVAAEAQTCAGVDYYEACLDAIAGRAAGATTPRDPTRIIDGIFRTSDTPPRYAPELTFARLMVDRSVFNYPSCMGGRNTDPRMYTANTCTGPFPPADVPPFVDTLDWGFSVTARSYADGTLVADGDPCGGDRARCGYEAPWASAMVMDLQGQANRVVVFPITDHVTDSCLEAFEYSVYLTNNPASRAFAGFGSPPDPSRWNAAVLVRGFTRGWTNNPQSTGTVADMAVHPLEMSPGGEAVADSIATVWALPCGVTFRYVALVPGNYGNPDGRCAFHSSEYEFDAVAGLNEDSTAVCADRDNDGFRDAACGGNDCNDNDPAVNPGAVETCATLRDLNCDGTATACPANTACVGGLCAPDCVEGACAAGFTCVSGDGGAASCLPTPCARTSCPAGQVCGPMGCQDPCDGARCPLGQVCRGGACTDPCAGVLCATRQHCEAGRCVPNCPCVPCGDGTSCDESSGRCGAPGCAMLTCAPDQARDCSGLTPRCRALCEDVRCPLGSRCDALLGRCVVDRCAGVSCPGGGVCRDGRCERPAVMDAGADAGSDASANDAGTGDAGAVVDAGRDAAMDAADDVAEYVADDRGGCGCRARGGAAGGAAWLVALAALARRRGRR